MYGKWPLVIIIALAGLIAGCASSLPPRQFDILPKETTAETTANPELMLFPEDNAFELKVTPPTGWAVLERANDEIVFIDPSRDATIVVFFVSSDEKIVTKEAAEGFRDEMKSSEEWGRVHVSDIVVSAAGDAATFSFLAKAAPEPYLAEGDAKARPKPRKGKVQLRTMGRDVHGKNIYVAVFGRWDAKRDAKFSPSYDAVTASIRVYLPDAIRADTTKKRARNR